MQVLPEVVARLCRDAASELYTPIIWQGSPLDKVRLLWGIAGVESSFGLNCNPRHEDGYCHGGRYFDVERTRKWGCLAHCSFGPWQVMYANFPEEVSPLSLVWESDGRIAAQLCLRGAIDVLNRAIGYKADNLGKIVVHYNGPANEADYSAKLEVCMSRPMPESPAVSVA